MTTPYTIYAQTNNANGYTGAPLKLPPGVRRDSYTIYEDVLADDIRNVGLHVTLEPGYEAALRDKLAVELTRLRLGGNSTGILAFDIEEVTPLYDPSVLTCQRWEAWCREIRADEMSSFPSEAEYFRATYEEQQQRWYAMLFRIVREICPKMLLGVYGKPDWCNQEYGYADPNEKRIRNDRLKYLWDLSDVVMPCLYVPRMIVAKVTDHTIEATPENIELYYSTNITEARRCAGPDKLVIPFVRLEFDKPRTPIDGLPLPDANLWAAYVRPALLGANGVISWNPVGSDAQRVFLQAQMDRLGKMLASGFAKIEGASVPVGGGV